MPFNLSTLQQANAKRWAAAKLTRGPEYKHPVSIALAAKPRYEAIQAATGVHWVFIATAHYRECSQNFSLSLAQGDPWDKRSTNVPANRGPFSSFEEAAVDALVRCPPYAAHNTDWSMPNMLTLEEAYNGLKYAYAGVPSPYIWSGTDQYTIGKVIRDHGPIEPVVDKQLGVAGFIISLLQEDHSITFPSPPDASGKVTDAIKSLPGVVLPKTAEAPQGLSQEVWDWIKEH